MKRAVLTKLRLVHHSAPLEVASRFGYVMNGLIHLLLGIAVISLGFGLPEEADASGVLSPFSRSWYGVIFLMLITIGLFALGTWYIFGAGLARKTKRRNDWKFIVSHTARGVTYLALAATTLIILVTAGRGKSSAVTSVEFTDHLLRTPVGLIVLCLLAGAIAVVGAVFIHRGLSRHFLETVTLPNKHYAPGITYMGVIGYISKGVTLLLLGYVFLLAALTHSANKASGLDAAFRVLIELPLGKIVLVLLGIGYVLYAAYSLARGRYSNLQQN